MSGLDLFAAGVQRSLHPAVRVARLGVRRAALVSWIALSWSGLTAAAEPEIRIDRDNDAFRIDASLLVEAHHHIAWQVLTDYNNLAAFVPGLRTSRIISAPGEPLVLRQTGQAGFLAFTFPVEFVARLMETPLEAIRFEAVCGNLERNSGAWRIEARDDMTRVNYRAEIVPGFWVPALIGVAVMGQDVRSKLVAIAAEMRRRQASDSAARPVIEGKP
jgi:ribosome-associated toxin RatA of RatAB toxin-antitoxin module